MRGLGQRLGVFRFNTLSRCFLAKGCRHTWRQYQGTEGLESGALGSTMDSSPGGWGLGASPHPLLRRQCEGWGGLRSPESQERLLPAKPPENMQIQTNKDFHALKAIFHSCNSMAVFAHRSCDRYRKWPPSKEHLLMCNTAVLLNSEKCYLMY